jgi:hypothetical protein
MSKLDYSNTRGRVEKFPASGGQIACQNHLPLSGLESGRYDLQMITFRRFRNGTFIEAGIIIFAIP